MSEPKAWEKMTVAEQMAAARDRQASVRLDAEVRTEARARDLNAKEVEGLVDRARAEFVFVNGEPQPVQADRKTPLRREDGGLLTVAEWVSATLATTPGTEPSAALGMPGRSLAPRKNPFKRSSWNLTEQMRSQRRDPELASRLKAAG